MRSSLAKISLWIVVVVVFAGAGWALPSASNAAEEQPKAEAEPHGHEDGKVSVPGMTMEKPDRDLALWSLVTFIVFVFVLGKFAWKPLIAGLDKREASVLDNIAAAETARVKAEKMLAEHAAKLGKVQDEVREILAEARRDAEHTKNEIVALAQQEADASRHRAVSDIERARDQALDDLFEHMSKIVEEATAHVVGRSLTGADHERLIDEALGEFSKRKH
jgi:F-type H+-transporting ATPase subunit b